ncbi:MAG TPA: TetR family transcriptional regulator [Rhizobacter sp.]|nr:TetR family transcriptional regulator [Rhizobacter sp.]
MPHPKQRKQETRQKILRAAARLFAVQGFSATSIDEVMQACGLTRGGFYAHFRSKAQLHHEALELMQNDSPQGLPLLASLAKDVAHATPEVRHSYARMVERVRDRLRAEMADAPLGQDAALAATAMWVGALAVAQSVDDARFAAEMIEACHKAAQALREQAGTAPPEVYLWSAAAAPLH